MKTEIKIQKKDLGRERKGGFPTDLEYGVTITLNQDSVAELIQVLRTSEKEKIGLVRIHYDSQEAGHIEVSGADVVSTKGRVIERSFAIATSGPLRGLPASSSQASPM